MSFVKNNSVLFPIFNKIGNQHVILDDFVRNRGLKNPPKKIQKFNNIHTENKKTEDKVVREKEQNQSALLEPWIQCHYKINKGTGAGGSNTNYYGKRFEETTNNEKRLLEQGFVKNTEHDYLSKKFDDKTVTFVSQNKLKKYMKNKYKAEIFRCPDEAYIIEYTNGRIILKILEKKEQHVNGSVETKLWSGPSLQREYELILGEHIEVSYGFCINSFLKAKLISNSKKYTTLQKILAENNIVCLFGEDLDYFETLDKWLNNSL